MNKVLLWTMNIWAWKRTRPVIQTQFSDIQAQDEAWMTHIHEKMTGLKNTKYRYVIYSHAWKFEVLKTYRANLPAQETFKRDCIQKKDCCTNWFKVQFVILGNALSFIL